MSNIQRRENARIAQGLQVRVYDKYLESMAFQGLRKLAKERGISAAGTRQEIIGRLRG